MFSNSFGGCPPGGWSSDQMLNVAESRPDNWELWGDQRGDKWFVVHLERRYTYHIPFLPNDVPNYPRPRPYGYGPFKFVPLVTAIRGIITSHLFLTTSPRNPSGQSLHSRGAWGHHGLTFLPGRWESLSGTQLIHLDPRLQVDNGKS